MNWGTTQPDPGCRRISVCQTFDQIVKLQITDN